MLLLQQWITGEYFQIIYLQSIDRTRNNAAKKKETSTIWLRNDYTISRTSVSATT